MTAPVTTHLELRGIDKRYGATHALRSVDLLVRRGTVHALVGENGAGKSTLGKVVTGLVRPDTGQVLLDGAPVELRSPRQALAAGLAMVSQELSLVPERSAAENVFLGIEPGGPVVRRARVRQAFERLQQEHGIAVPDARRVADLAPGERQKVEVLRALARRAELVVMDEPTARLSGDEVTALRSLVRRLSAAGTTVLFVSHFLEEVLALADVVTVMRDGRVVRTGPAADETRESLVEGMTGAAAEAAFPSRTPRPPDAAEVLRVQGLRRRGVLHGIDLTVRAGEVVVLAGLVGSGRSEVLRAVCGADPVDGGTMHLQGRPWRPRSPADAWANEVTLVPESRKEQGLVPLRPVRENVSLPWLGGFRFGPLIRRRQEQRAVQVAVRDADVRGAGTETSVVHLSGGNQQKTLFARALLTRPRLLLVDEPTRGVDVAAKRSLYDLVRRAADDGLAVLAVSSEGEEVLGLADRILVLRAGRLVAELDGPTASPAALVNAAFDLTVPPRPVETP